MLLPIFHTKLNDLSLLQTNWASVINPVLAQPMSSGLLLKDVALANGTTVINHKLSRKMQGWIIVDLNGAASIYRSQPLNDLTLTLTSNAAVTASLFVF